MNKISSLFAQYPKYSGYKHPSIPDPEPENPCPGPYDPTPKPDDSIPGVPNPKPDHDPDLPDSIRKKHIPLFKP